MPAVAVLKKPPHFLPQERVLDYELHVPRLFIRTQDMDHSP